MAERLRTAYVDALEASGRRVSGAWEGARASVRSTASKSYGDVVVSYRDLETLTAILSRHSAFVVSKANDTARVVADGDFLESAVLSPVTAGTASAALLSAATQLTAGALVVEAVTLIAAGAASAYQAADSALELAAATAAGGGRVVWAVGVSGAEQQAAPLKMVAGAVYVSSVAAYVVGVGVSASLSGAVSEATRALVAAVEKAAATAQGNPFALAAAAAQNFATEWSNEHLWEQFLLNTEAHLGALGDLYPVVLKGLLASGAAWGLFRDGTATVSASANTADDRKGLRATATTIETFLSAHPSLLASSAAGNRGTFDENFRYLPRDLTGLLFGAYQIDNEGVKDHALIRIMDSTDESGNRFYTVQIPSTQSWSPITRSLPNDLTSDVTALAAGDSTALARSVYSAMELAGISETDPVMLVGFSLGGITAAAIAAGNQKFNISHVVTAGAPVGGIKILDAKSAPSVLSLEAHGDIVPHLDGTTNPSHEKWQTIREPSELYNYEKARGDNTTSSHHEVLRYALLAEKHSAATGKAEIQAFLSGQLRVRDFKAARK